MADPISIKDSDSRLKMVILKPSTQNHHAINQSGHLKFHPKLNFHIISSSQRSRLKAQ